MHPVLSIAFFLFITTDATVPWQAEFDKFCADYGRKYIGIEKERRFEVFVGNMKIIEAHNSRKDSWTMGINEFSDWSPKEWQMFVGTERGNASFSNTEPIPKYDSVDVTTESTFDWRDHGCITDVRRQSCGDSYAHSAVEMLESAYCIHGGGYRHPPSYVENNVQLSIQSVMQCRTQDACRGGSAKDVLGWVLDNGICTESTYPYEGESDQCKSGSCAKVYPSFTVHNSHSVSPDQLARAILQGPVSIDILAPPNGYSGGIFDGECEHAHQVNTVGFSQSYWIVKNSWGSYWGENGYIRFARHSGGPGVCGMYSRSVTFPSMKGGGLTSMPGLARDRGCEHWMHSGGFCLGTTATTCCGGGPGNADICGLDASGMPTCRRSSRRCFNDNDEASAQKLGDGYTCCYDDNYRNVGYCGYCGYESSWGVEKYPDTCRLGFNGWSCYRDEKQLPFASTSGMSCYPPAPAVPNNTTDVAVHQSVKSGELYYPPSPALLNKPTDVAVQQSVESGASYPPSPALPNKATVVV
mmetsp:Transcript_56479/g.98396  ORF Transcript_56479/g.98396 Transcript_56479/m.98396 type:complete len:525 (+) Transcript_56479:64-1638(+)